MNRIMQRLITVAGEEFADDLTQCTTRFLIQQKNAYHRLHLHTIIDKRVVKMSVICSAISAVPGILVIYIIVSVQDTNSEHFIPHSYRILLFFIYYIIITCDSRASMTNVKHFPRILDSVSFFRLGTVRRSGTCYHKYSAIVR